MSQLVGKESKNIYSIMKATGTLRMFVVKAEEAPESVIIKEDDVILAIVGFKDAVQKAKLFVEFQIAYIHEIQSLRLTKFKIHEKMIAYSKSRSELTSNSFPTQTNNTKQGTEIGQLTPQTDVYDHKSVNPESSKINSDMSMQSNEEPVVPIQKRTSLILIGILLMDGQTQISQVWIFLLLQKNYLRSLSFLMMV